MTVATASVLQTSWFDTGAHAIRYRTRYADKPCIVLLHQIGGSVDSWASVIDQLPDHLSLIVPELRGMGVSDRIKGPFSFRDLAADVDALLDHLRIDSPVVVVGCAVGAAVGLQLALDRPERYALALALAPACSTEAANRTAVLRMADRIECDGIASLKETLLGMSYPQIFRDRQPEAFARFRSRWVSNRAASLAAFFRTLAKADMRADLPGLQARTIFVAGSHDTLRPPEYVKALADAVPDARFLEIEAAHEMNETAPNRVAQLVQSAVLELGHMVANKKTTHELQTSKREDTT